MPLNKDRYVPNDRMTPKNINTLLVMPTDNPVLTGSRYVLDITLSELHFTTGCFFCGNTIN
jgi:hypothetical protein